MAGCTLTGSAGKLSPDPILSVSVVTYNSRHCLPAFLASLQRQRDVSWELFFFDNASRDGTGEVIRQEVMGELIISKENLGYGRAHNRNVVRCRGAYLLFLNPDLEFGPDLFSALVGYLEQHPEHGLAGPRILEGDSRQEFLPRRFYPGEGMVALEAGLRRHVAWVSGCCLLVRSKVFDMLGGFDHGLLSVRRRTRISVSGRGRPATASAMRMIPSCTISTVKVSANSPSMSIGDDLRRQCPVLGEALRTARCHADGAISILGHQDTSETGGFRWWLPVPAVLSETRPQARNDVCGSWLEKRGCRRMGLPASGRFSPGNVVSPWNGSGREDFRWTTTSRTACDCV